MPGSERLHVKRELQSDDEESNSQFCGAFGHQLSEYIPIKLEPASQDDDNGSPNLLHHLHCVEGALEELSPAAPAATPARGAPPAAPAASFATLEPACCPAAVGSSLIDRHIKMMCANEVADSADFAPLMSIKDEPTSEGEQQHLSGDDTSDSSGAPPEGGSRGSPKSWTQQDMEKALEALRKHHMSLTKASATYGIPSTTLWQRAHRLGIDTPKKEGAAKSWSDADLRGALLALRAGAISANKASKAYGIPSSTLYKIARREGIRLAAPFNAAPTAWRRADLERALHAIRCGAASVQRAAAMFGIPTGTLYGRCKREGIELSRSNPTPWSEDAMGEALEAVRVGQMSINQAAIHYNLPYSSLYGRFKRCKYPPQQSQPMQPDVPALLDPGDLTGEPRKLYPGDLAGEPRKLYPGDLAGEPRKLYPGDLTGEPRKLYPGDLTGESRKLYPGDHMGEPRKLYPGGDPGEPQDLYFPQEHGAYEHCYYAPCDVSS